MKQFNAPPLKCLYCREEMTYLSLNKYVCLSYVCSKNQKKILDSLQKSK